MVSESSIREFLKQKKLAVVGVSRSEKKFSSILYKNLKTKGYNLFAVNPNTEKIKGEDCYDSIKSIPETVEGVVIVVPPNQTENIVKEAISLGIRHIWIQQGAESREAIEICKKNAVNVIHNQCILMFAEPTTFPHNIHRHLWKFLGKIPK